MKWPDRIENVEMLEELLAVPPEALVEAVKRLDGDIMILGIAGKMGVSMGRLAMNAIREAGVKKKVIGVSRFSNADDRAKLEEWGIETLPCDLLERAQVDALPKVKNVVFMAGRKFGTEGSEALTWAMSTLAPSYAAEHFRESRIVAFSTGCVYPLATVGQGGCTEEVVPAPVGDYSQSCLGRERIFDYASRKFGTKLLLFRLNYAVDLRYGVLHDIGRSIWEGREVDNSVNHFNVIWQGDANANALRALELCENPGAILNVTGPETASVEQVALRMGRLMEKDVRFKGTPGQLQYLNNSAKMCRIFGYPRVSLEQLILWQADWIRNGGVSIGKPTHFEVSNGKF